MWFKRATKRPAIKRLDIWVLGPVKPYKHGVTQTKVEFSLFIKQSDVNQAYSELEDILFRRMVSVNFTHWNRPHSTTMQEFGDKVSFKLACKRVDEFVMKYAYLD